MEHGKSAAGHMKNNVDRFSGFGDLYDRHRPEAPKQVVGIIKTYLQGNPSLVVDVGCGTGLSSFIWIKDAGRVLGVEPNDDMLGKAREKLSRLDASDVGRIAFVQGYSHQLEVESGAADVVTCSQSFHWMEPVSTLREIARVLRAGGVFAAYDCDWPVTVGWAVEKEYQELIRKADDVIARLSEPEVHVRKWNKEQHLQNMTDSGHFRYTKEIVFHNMEACDAERFIGLALSQGGIQTVFKLGTTELNADIEAFKRNVEAHFGGQTLQLMFSYRMRLGVK